MKDLGIVTGSEQQAKPLIVGIDTVYVHTDIKKLDDTEERKDLYEYHEIQYTKDEYIQIMSDKNTELEASLEDTQLAVCDLYEMIIK